MRVALTYNLRPTEPPSPSLPEDLYAEWDEPATIAAVHDALASQHEVLLIENTATVEDRLRDSAPDIVFNLAEGLGGSEREAYIPAFLERWHIPFTGSSAQTLRTCLDKAATKRILQQHGLATPAYAVLGPGDAVPGALPFPLVVKPVHEGSSKGIYSNAVVHDGTALQARVAHIVETYQQPALVEAFVSGREFSVALLGNGPTLTVLPLVEIDFTALPAGAPPLYSYEAKWLWDTPARPLALLRCPAQVPAPLQQAIQRLCCRAFQVLGCRDWCRLDVRLGTNGQPSILEVNPLPGILPDPASHSCFPHAAAAANVSYAALIRRVLAHACQRYGLASTS